MGLTKEDVEKISAALTINRLEPSDWAFFYLVMGDLGVSSEKLKEIKELKSSKIITDSEALSRLLQNWVDNCGDKTASLDDLISAMSSNTDKLPGLAKQDFVGYLNQIRKKMGLESDSVLSPMEIVFNSVDLICVEIYKYLSKYDKGCLRLTSKSIWSSTLSNWRKTVRLRIGSGASSVTMKELHEIHLKQEGGIGSYELGKLIEHPFTNYGIHKETISPFRETWTEWELHFWTKCAPHVINLNLNNCWHYEYSFLLTYLWLVTKACPKIEHLNIHRINPHRDNLHRKYVNEFDDRAEELEENEGLDNIEEDPLSCRQILKCLKGVETDFCETPQGIANNLKTLSLCHCCDSSLDETTLFLHVAPNLKGLETTDSIYLKGLQTCSDRGICKLSNICIYSDILQDYAALETYTKTYPDVIKRIELHTRDFREWTEHNSAIQLYQTILQCSMALVALDLSFKILSNNYDEEKLWFDQLSTAEFPSLRELKLYFHNPSEMVYWDFATLLKTPNLRKLSIQHYSVEEFLNRQCGTMDWIRDEQSLEGNPLRLDKLEEFTFDGWGVNKDDLTLFRDWFPSLKYLEVGLGASPDLLLNIFKDLRSLTLTAKCEVPKDEVILAKILHPEVRIFKEFANFGKLEAVEGDKGRLNIVFKPETSDCINDIPMQVLKGLSLK